MNIIKSPLGIILGLLSLCMLGSLQSIMAQQFEGTLTYEIEANGASQDLTYFMKSDHARVEIASEELGGKIAILIDTANENMTVLMEQLSVYMEIPIPNDEEAGDEDRAEDFHLTGEKMTIANYECQQYIYTDENGAETEIWTPVEADFGSFLFPEMGDNSMGNMKQPDMPAFSFFPFLLISDSDGEPVRMEVVSVEKGELNDSMFTVPQNYRKMNMPIFGN